MPISPLALQRRHAELGRIRLGVKKDITKRNGQPGTRPEKLDRYRFTSAHQRHVESLAALYGGEPKPWDNNGLRQYEVITNATSIPVIVLKGSISQWMETWSGGGCTHRCDGFHDVLSDTDCREDDPAHAQAKATTRLSVMLSELDAIGVWRLESHGWNAAAELPGVVEMAAMVADLVPADLVLREQRAIVDGQTTRFVVPGLDLHVQPRRLAAIAQAAADGVPGPVAVAGTEQRTAIASAPAAALASVPREQPRPAQPAGRPAPSGPARDWPVEVGQVRTLDELRSLGQQAQGAGVMEGEVLRAFQVRAQQLESGAAQPAADEPVDEAPPVDEPAPAAAAAGDVNGAWQQLLVTAGDRGLDVNAVDQVLSDLYPDVTPGEYTAQQMLDAIGSLPRAQAGAA